MLLGKDSVGIAGGFRADLRARRGERYAKPSASRIIVFYVYVFIFYNTVFCIKVPCLPLSPTHDGSRRPRDLPGCELFP